MYQRENKGYFKFGYWLELRSCIIFIEEQKKMTLTCTFIKGKIAEKPFWDVLGFFFKFYLK